LISPLLLDTCAAIWTTQTPGLSDAAQAAIAETERAGVAVYISPITAWEVGLLVARGRLALRVPPKRWFRELEAAGLQLAPLSPEILIEASALPGDLHRDPADRILAATAREFGYRLMTRDKPLLAYAAGGYLDAIAC
jgi:PIN domain nuclease of toxin-antitoxin system